MFCEDVKKEGYSDEYVLNRAGFSSCYSSALLRVSAPEYYIKKDIVKEFCNVGIHDKVDVSEIDMGSDPVVITFNLSESRSVEVLVVKYWWCEYSYIDAYCMIRNSLVKTEEFFILPISSRFSNTFGSHRFLNIGSDVKLDIWKVILHSIMADIDELFEERDGVMVSKSVTISKLGVFAQFVSGHYKRIRYGRGRKKTKSKYVKSYWRSDGK